MSDEKFPFLVLDTKIDNGSIFIYGGLLPSSQEIKSKEETHDSTVTHFEWFKLERVQLHK